MGTESTTSAENRNQPRIEAGMRVAWKTVPPDGAQRPVSGTAGDVSEGGMFIATQQPAARGRILDVDFYPQAGGMEMAPLHGRVVVCWRRRWRQPHGMGVRFTDEAALGDRRLASWIRSFFAARH